MSVMNFGRIGGTALLAVTVMVVADTVTPAVSGGVMDSSECCFTKCCPDGSGGFNCATSCRGGCASNQVCSGHGGCIGTQPWAVAECIAQP
jgi:hypothetical protein